MLVFGVTQHEGVSRTVWAVLLCWFLAVLLVCSGCWSKYAAQAAQATGMHCLPVLEAGRLGGWEAGIQVLAGLAPSGAFLLSLQTAAFLRVLTWSSVCACGHVPPCCDQALSRAHLCMSPFELDQQRQKCNRAVRW